MKIIFCLFAFALSYTVFAQEHVSHYFDLQNEFVLPEQSCVYQPGRFIGCIAGDVLYVSRNEAVKNKKNGFILSVDAVNLKTKEFRTLTLRIPPVKNSTFLIRDLWVSSLQAMDGKMIVSTNFQLLVYDLDDKAELKLLNEFPNPEPYFGFYSGKKVYAISEIHDYGFISQCQSGSHLDTVAKFPLKAPFIVQYGPNGFIKYYAGKLYFLDPPSNQLKIYDLSGNLIQTKEIDVAGWNPFPDSYINEVMAKEYGADRAISVYYSSKDYSFPLEVFPLNDKNVMVAYHHKLPQFKDFKLYYQMFRQDARGVEKQVWLTPDFEKDHVIEETEFPFIFASHVMLLNVVAENIVVQLVRASGVDYVGKTWSAYLKEDNDSLASQRPKVVARVMRIRPEYREMPVDSLSLMNFAGQPFKCDSISSPRAIFILNRQPQCHACELELSAFVNTLGLSKCDLYTIDSYADSYLIRRDRIDIAKQRIHVPFTSLFLSGQESERLPELMDNSAFPVVLLWERGSSNFRVLSEKDLFPDNLRETTLRGETSDYLQQFAR